MVIIIILAAIVLIAGWYLTESFLAGFLFSLLSVVVGIFIMLIPSSIYANSVELTYTHEDFTIVSMQDNTTMSGRGFLIVSIGANREYTYYIQNKDGSYEQKSMRVNNVKIFEEDTEDAYLRIVTGKVPTSIWLLPWDDSISYEFHIPKGSIIQKFELDAK